MIEGFVIQGLQGSSTCYFRMHTWADPIPGAASNHKQQVFATRADIHEVINEKLHEWLHIISQKQTIDIQWKGLITVDDKACME